MSLVIDISVSRIDYLLTVQAQRTEDHAEAESVRRTARALTKVDG